MAQPTQEEVDRSVAIRPAVQARIDRENLSLSAAARAMGSNPETVRQFLNDRTATGSNLEMFERWAAGGNGSTRYTDASGGPPLSRQVDDILHSDADDLTKTAQLIDLWGIYRQKAISDVAELIRGDREILLLRAKAVRDLTRTTRLEAEQAARREDRFSSDLTAREVADIGLETTGGSQLRDEGTPQDQREQQR